MGSIETASGCIGFRGERTWSQIGDWRNNETMTSVEKGKKRRRAAVLQDTMKIAFAECLHNSHPFEDYPLAGSAAILCAGGADVIPKEAWPFYRTSSGVRLCCELEEPKGPKKHETEPCINTNTFQNVEFTTAHHIQNNHVETMNLALATQSEAKAPGILWGLQKPRGPKFRVLKVP